MAAPGASLDTRREIVTPENIAFHYRLAGPFQRYGAWLIDLAIKFGIVFGVGFVVLTFTNLSGTYYALPFLFLTWFVVSWFYGGLLEMYWNGRTPGKGIFSLRVVGTRGQPLNAWQAFLRNILREVDLFPVLPMLFVVGLFPDESSLNELVRELHLEQVPVPLGAVGLLCCMLSPNYQRLGDLAANTMVIVEERPYVIGLASLRDVQARQLADELPPTLRLSRRTARALAKYVDRRRVFSPQRRGELSRRLGAPLRERFAIPTGMNDDQLLCALYFRTFIGNNEQQPDSSAVWQPPGAPR